MSDALEQIYRDTRAQSLAYCAPLQIEDYGLQAQPFVSPPKWHLAHTSWFFETFLLKPFLDDYKSPDERYEVLFNSYYNGIGEQFSRPQRGLLSRPCVEEVIDYRSHVDQAMTCLLAMGSHPDRSELISRTILGVEHERQHQELFFTDIKYSLAVNPLLPIYAEAPEQETSSCEPLQWRPYQGGLIETGFAGKGFCFDNELPRHKTFLNPFELANRLVSNGDYQAFIEDGGYQRPELWLADGWATVQSQGWHAPQYWLTGDNTGAEYTLHGVQPRQASAPVCHISGYEADAYARWAGARLPTEAEWEHAAADAAAADTAASTSKAAGGDTQYYHPRAPVAAAGLQQLYGNCWQWTQSAYSPYPGFSASQGAIGEYNGKFMSNQWVLRGGSCVSPPSQMRTTYRNFFYPQDRWQFTGIRLARNPVNPLQSGKNPTA